MTGSCVLRETRIDRGCVARFSIYRARDRRGSRARATGRVAAAMALSKLSGDEQGIILGQLRNRLEPRLAMYFSSASTVRAAGASAAGGAAAAQG